MDTLVWLTKPLLTIGFPKCGRLLNHCFSEGGMLEGVGWLATNGWLLIWVEVGSWNPIIYRVLYIQMVVVLGFLNHQQYQLVPETNGKLVDLRARWFRIRIGVPPRIPIPFIFGNPRNPNHRAPNQHLLPISWLKKAKEKNIHGKMRQWSGVLVGGWTNPFEQICSSKVEIFPRGENKRCLKPSPTYPIPSASGFAKGFLGYLNTEPNRVFWSTIGIM